MNPEGQESAFIMIHALGVIAWPMFDVIYLCYFIFLGIKKALGNVKSPKVFKTLGERLYGLLGDNND